MLVLIVFQPVKKGVMHRQKYPFNLNLPLNLFPWHIQPTTDNYQLNLRRYTSKRTCREPRDTWEFWSA